MGVVFCGFPRKPGYPDFGHGGMGFANKIKFWGRKPLPLSRNELLIAFHQGVFRPMSPAGGVVPHHRLIDDHAQFRLGFELLLRLLGRLLGIFWLCTHAISASPRNTLPVSITVRTMAA